MSSYQNNWFRSDWIAIKKKTDQDIEDSGQTVGEYIYKNLLVNPKDKIRGKAIGRKASDETKNKMSKNRKGKETKSREEKEQKFFGTILVDR